MFVARTSRPGGALRALAIGLTVFLIALSGCSFTEEDTIVQPTTPDSAEFGVLMSVVDYVCLSLPTDPVDAAYVHPGSSSFFNTTLSNVPGGYDVTDGTYVGWCVEDNFQNNSPNPITLHCSLDGALPGNLGSYPWDKVNYLLNHKAGTAEEIEAAIWVLVYGASYTFPVTQAVTAMVDDANVNGVGYAPGPGEIIAVILYTGDGGIGPDGFQDTIIEVLIPEEPGLEGCTPGYWKNHPGAWDTTAYGTDVMVGSVFGESVAYPEIYSATLMEALSFKGGPGELGAARNLLRAAVASLLNASSSNVDFPHSVAAVIAATNDALASGDRATMLNVAKGMDFDNNAGCPLGLMGARNIDD